MLFSSPIRKWYAIPGECEMCYMTAEALARGYEGPITLDCNEPYCINHQRDTTQENREFYRFLGILHPDVKIDDGMPTEER